MVRKSPRIEGRELDKVELKNCVTSINSTLFLFSGCDCKLSNNSSIFSGVCFKAEVHRGSRGFGLQIDSNFVIKGIAKGSSGKGKLMMDDVITMINGQNTKEMTKPNFKDIMNSTDVTLMLSLRRSLK